MVELINIKLEKHQIKKITNLEDLKEVEEMNKSQEESGTIYNLKIC